MIFNYIAEENQISSQDGKYWWFLLASLQACETAAMILLKLRFAGVSPLSRFITFERNTLCEKYSTQMLIFDKISSFSYITYAYVGGYRFILSSASTAVVPNVFDAFLPLLILKRTFLPCSGS